MLSGGKFWVAYQGDGVTTNFTVPFYYIDQNDLVVTVAAAGGTPVSQTQNVTYSVIDVPVNGVRAAGGTVSFMGAPGAGSTVLITRRTNRTQERVYAENDPFPAKSHELALDKLTLLVQEIMHQYQGVADGPPTSGTRDDGSSYIEGDWFIKRHFLLGDVLGYIYASDGMGGLTWAQFGQISLLPGMM